MHKNEQSLHQKLDSGILVIVQAVEEEGTLPSRSSTVPRAPSKQVDYMGATGNPVVRGCSWRRWRLCSTNEGY